MKRPMKKTKIEEMKVLGKKDEERMKNREATKRQDDHRIMTKTFAERRKVKR